MEDRLPEGLNLGRFNGRQTYVETCNCVSCFCNQVTVFYQGTQEICWEQTQIVRTNKKAICGHVTDISGFDYKETWTTESVG